jgi:CDP-glucose 4,6-dehydratase
VDGGPMSSPWRYRRVFVTGATGLLGSAMVEELVRQEAEVTILLRDWVPTSRLIRLGLLDKVQVVHGELEDGEVVLRALNEYEIDSVFHLAAQAVVGTALRSVLSTFESNIRGTWNILEACRICSRRIERVVVASSDKAYGAHDALPYTETTPLEGRFPYDVSKACADLLAFSSFHTYGVPVAVTRCGNLFGPGDLNFNRLIPGTIRSVLRGERPVIRSDGTYLRDYFYVRDAVEAYLTLAARLPGEGCVGEAFNFGNETPLSVLEVVARVLRVMGRPDLEPIILNEARGEIPRQYLDCSKARSRLAWAPSHSFETGLTETIAWYRAALEDTPPESRRPGCDKSE